MFMHNCSKHVAHFLAASTCLLVLLNIGTVSAQAQAIIPTQFIAKMYTEALGRAPDQGGWASYSNYFAQNGCNAASLQHTAAAFLTSSEFDADNRDAVSKVLAIYRTALNRDADMGGLTNYANQLNNGISLGLVVNEVLNSQEFRGNVAPYYCNADPNYAFFDHPVPTPTPGTVGYSGSEAGLQAQLNCAAAKQCASPVVLAQKAVIKLTRTLTVPAGVALQTYDNPSPRHYTQMARLVRATSFDGPNLAIAGGAQLTSVWVDGQRNVLGYYKQAGHADHANLTSTGGTNTLISGNKMSDPQGGSNFFVGGKESGPHCWSETISWNLITGYTGVHGFNSPADGLTVQCENTVISNNSIIDMTDNGIVLFGSVQQSQASKIYNNIIIAAGNSMNAPIAIDEITGDQYPLPGQHVCYAGTMIQNNTFWTGPYTTYDFGIQAGAREYFAPQSGKLVTSSCPNPNAGPEYLNNTTGSLSAHVHAGIAVAGVLAVTIANDNQHPLNFTLTSFKNGTPAAGCPSAMVIAEENLGQASGHYPVPDIDKDFDFCITQTPYHTH